MRVLGVWWELLKHPLGRGLGYQGQVLVPAWHTGRNGTVEKVTSLI